MRLLLAPGCPLPPSPVRLPPCSLQQAPCTHPRPLPSTPHPHPHAGAKKVYAVEATDMAKFAKRLVAAQGLEGVVEVIQGVIESVDIPEKVDIIISEWMVSRALRRVLLRLPRGCCSARCRGP